MTDALGNCGGDCSLDADGICGGLCCSTDAGIRVWMC